MTAGVDRVRPLLAAHLPDYQSAEIRCLGSGVDHIAYLVGGALIVRLARNPAGAPPVPSSPSSDPSNETEREAQLLRVVARYSTLPVPIPLVVADGMLAYRALRGVPVLSRSQDWRQARATDLGNVLGAFLASLRSIPVDNLIGLCEVDNEPPSAWLADAQECWATVSTWATTGFPKGTVGRIDTFLVTPPPAQCDEVRFSHNDLGAEHVLVDARSGVVTGVIDWTDAAITDPAVDLGLLLRDLGDDAFRAAARHWAAAPHRLGTDPTNTDPTNTDPTDTDPTTTDPTNRDPTNSDPTPSDAASLRDRAVFYARCRLLEDVRFGIENDRPEYVRNSVTAAEWLFAD